MKLRQLAFFAALAAAAPSANAQISFVASQGAFGTPAGIADWSVLGPSVSEVPWYNSLNTTIPGLSMNVWNATTRDMYRMDEGDWDGNFAHGAPLLYNANQGTLEFQFSQLISGFGTQIQGSSYGTFTGSIAAYDEFSQLIGAYGYTGNSTGGDDNTAIFIGIQSTSPNIARIRIYESDFAIGNVLLQQTDSLPEPASLVLFGTGLAGLVVLRKRIRTS